LANIKTPLRYSPKIANTGVFWKSKKRQ